MQKTSRTRTWTCISYEPTDHIVSVLENLHIAYAYNTHDRDNKPTHTHIIIQYPSVKSMSQARADLEEISANGYVEPVRNTRAAIRYLSHLDNPEKTQYDYPTARNWDITKFLDSENNPQSTAVKTMKEIIAYINSNDISYYKDLLDLLEKDGLDNLYYYAISKRYLQPIMLYLKSKDCQEQRRKHILGNLES